ncbi:MAG: tetratricopeptide repeat protein [Bacteroidota bacterium]|nr:tetratricopeptide repeat protein [Bacteroidota bacterium]
MKTTIKTNLEIISMIVLILAVLCRSNVSAVQKSENITKSVPGWSSEKEFQQLQEFSLEDDSLKAGLLKAQNLAQQGKKEEASKIYTDLMEIYLHEKEPVKGWLMLNMKRSPTGEEEAIQSLDQLGKLYQKNSAIIFWRMFLEAEHAQNEAAMKDVDYLIRLQPDSAVNWVAKGQIHAEMKQFEEASKAFDKATKLDPKRPDVWGMKAGTLAKLGKYDEALLSANKGIELMPASFVGIYNRACVYSLKGDKANALADLKKAIELNPSIKRHAQTDEDFKSLWDDEDFKNTTK